MTKKKLKDFARQARNANKHSTRGMGMLDDVISNDGWIGAITTAADGEVFAGSARLEVACDRFGAEIEPIVIESDGTRPIVVVRTDIASASDPKAIKLGVADNRINQVNYIEDLEVLAEIAEDIDLSSLYFDDELSDLLEGEDDVLGDLELDYSDKNKEVDTDNMDSSGTFKFTFEYEKYLELIARFNQYKSDNEITEDNEAFAKLLDA